MVRPRVRSERLPLLNFFVAACLPGDISNQIRLLEQYAKSTFDILGHLPPQVAVQVIEYLTVPELLGIETVSRKWSAMVRQPAIWRYHCLALTATDPVPLRPPSKPEDWCVHFKRWICRGNLMVSMQGAALPFAASPRV